MADAVIERYVYDDIHNSLASLDGGNVVLDFVDSDGAGTQPMQLAKRYLYGEMVDQILAQEDVTKNLSATDRVLWPLVENLGTVRNLAKQDGTIAAHYRYDAYGNVTSGDTSLTSYLFTSRVLDTDTGLQYNRARWYDPDVGRWVSEDPLGFVAGDGNVTRYVGNGVTFGRDPSGLWSFWDWLKTVLSHGSGGEASEALETTPELAKTSDWFDRKTNPFGGISETSFEARRLQGESLTNIMVAEKHCNESND